MRRIWKTEQWTFKAGILMLFLVLMTFRQLGGTYARYTSSASGSDGARVALFGQSETIELFHNSSTMFYPGVSATSNIIVTNQSDGKVSEVAQQYSIEIETAGTLPFQFTLKQGENTIGTFNESSQENDENSGKSHVFSTDGMKFEAGVGESTSYTLETLWPAGENDPALAGIPDYITVNIKVEQID